MWYDLLIPLVLIPGMLLGQDQQLSEAVRELLSKPHFGSAQLTWSDGRKEDGSIERITDQFVTFVTDRKPPSCENVELSKIAGVHWRVASASRSLSDLGAMVLIGAVMFPSFLGHEVAYPFRRMFPPLPLRGTWESIGGLHGGVKSSLHFDGRTVQRREVIVKQGRYHVEQDRLYLMFTGSLETVTRFHFNCRKLILDRPEGTFFDVWNTPHRVSAPVVGEWHNSGYVLELKPDGSFEERKEEHRNGTFEMMATGVRILWADSQATGGEQWNADFKHRHLVVRVGSVTTSYRYVPPMFAVGL